MKSKQSHLKSKDLSYSTIKCKGHLFIKDPLFNKTKELTDPTATTKIQSILIKMKNKSISTQVTMDLNLGQNSKECKVKNPSISTIVGN